MNIGKGDMVMVVRGAPCCGSMGNAKYGLTSTADEVGTINDAQGFMCVGCGMRYPNPLHVALTEKGTFPIFMLKKIEPPAEGDSLPTRADLEITA